MKLKQLLMMAGIAAVMSLSASKLLAQEEQRSERRGRGGPGGNFDPAQFQQRMMDNLRDQMKVKDDAEWKVIEERLQKVMEAQRDIGFGGGMRRLFRRPGGDGNEPGRGRGFGPEPSAEEQALDKAIDSGASKEDLKAAMAKYRAAKKEKETKLTAAQEELKKILTTQQEAVALAAGLVK